MTKRLSNWNLNFFETGEWQVCHERLGDLRRNGVVINPDRNKLFLALEKLDPDRVKVVMVGQDPYPDHQYATGIAFSVADADRIPSTLAMIYDEYESDLRFPRPQHGNLEPWIEEGVLLWNYLPSCSEGHSLSHDWDEWYFLNKEIVDKLVELNQDCVFVLLGSVAKRMKAHIPPWLPIIETSHPSPRGNQFSKTPFIGSKIFSRTNAELVNLGKEPVNWRLPQ